jgi:hypothetical protein
MGSNTLTAETLSTQRGRRELQIKTPLILFTILAEGDKLALRKVIPGNSFRSHNHTHHRVIGPGCRLTQYAAASHPQFLKQD